MLQHVRLGLSYFSFFFFYTPNEDFLEGMLGNFLNQQMQCTREKINKLVNKHPDLIGAVEPSHLENVICSYVFVNGGVFHVHAVGFFLVRCWLLCFSFLNREGRTHCTAR